MENNKHQLFRQKKQPLEIPKWEISDTEKIYEEMHSIEEELRSLEDTSNVGVLPVGVDEHTYEENFGSRYEYLENRYKELEKQIKDLDHKNN